MGPLSPQASAARVQRRINELQDAVLCEAARWGRSGPPYKKKDWETAVYALQDMIRRRAGGTHEFLLSAKRYAHGSPEDDTVDAPLFNPIVGVRQTPLGGCYPANQIIKIATTDKAYFTVDGTDPRLSDGSINPKAFKVSAPSIGQAILTKPFLTTKVREKEGEAWGPLRINHYKREARPADRSNIVLSKVVQAPTDSECLEIHNVSQARVDLAHSAFVLGVRYVFPDAPENLLEPDERVLLVKDRRMHPKSKVRIVGEYQGKLADEGELLHFIDASGHTVWHQVLGAAD